MDSNRISLENISKSKQIAVLDKICNMQWLKHSTHLSDHTKPRSDSKAVRYSKNEQKIQQVLPRLSEDKQQNEEQNVEADGDKEKAKEQEVKKINSNVNESKDQIEERSVENNAIGMKESEEQEKEQNIVDSFEHGTQEKEYVKSVVISKSIEDECADSSEFIILIDHKKYDTNTEHSVIDRFESLELHSVSKDLLAQRQLPVLHEIKGEKKNVEIKQTRHNVESENWADSVCSDISKDEGEVEAEKQSASESNNDSTITKDISQINLNEPLNKVSDGEGDNNVRTINDELLVEANTTLNTKTISNENSEQVKKQADSINKEEFISKTNINENLEKSKVQQDENNKEELTSDKSQLNENSRNNHEIKGDETEVNYSATTNPKEPSDKMQVELNEAKYNYSSYSKNIQNKKEWTRNFTGNRSFFKSSSTKVDKPLPSKSMKESVSHDNNSSSGKNEQNTIASFDNSSADVRRNVSRVYYKHSKEGIERIETKENDKLSKNVTTDVFSLNKKTVENTIEKAGVTTNEKKKVDPCNRNNNRFNRNNLYENKNPVKKISANSLDNSNVLQYADPEANNHLSLNKDVELPYESTQNVYPSQSSISSSNYIGVNSTLNNNFINGKQTFIPNMQASNVLCVHQMFHPQNSYNMQVYDGLCFNNMLKEQVNFVNYPSFHYSNNFNMGQERNYMYQTPYFQPVYPANWNGCYPMPLQIGHLNCDMFGNQSVVHTTNINSWSNCNQVYQQASIDLQNQSDQQNKTEDNECVKNSDESAPPMVSPKACMLAASKLSPSKENLSDPCVRKVRTDLGHTLPVERNNVRSGYGRDNIKSKRFTRNVYKY